MNVAVITHVASEGPGTLGSFLESRGVRLLPLALYDGAKLPASTDGIDAVVCMGGPMNVYEEDAHPFLREETAFVKEAVSRGLPVLGICLGAQLIAKALGAPVTRSPREEVGWGRVSLTEAARDDALFRGLPETLEVIQWHGDMFHLPQGAVLLASSEACPHQAFRSGRAYGLQFHVEATGAMIAEWFADHPDLGGMLAHHGEIHAELDMWARSLYEGLLSLLRG